MRSSSPCATIAARKQSRHSSRSIRGKLIPRDRFLLATLYSAEGDWEKCRSETRKVLEGDSRQPRYLAFYVKLMIRVGELGEAENWLRTLKPLVARDQAGRCWSWKPGC